MEPHATPIPVSKSMCRFTAGLGYVQHACLVSRLKIHVYGSWLYGDLSACPFLSQQAWMVSHWVYKHWHAVFLLAVELVKDDWVGGFRFRHSGDTTHATYLAQPDRQHSWRLKQGRSSACQLIGHNHSVGGAIIKQERPNSNKRARCK